MNGMTMEHTNNLLTTLNAEQTAEAIKAAGCAVTSIEHDGVVRLHSASHGIGFQVLWGNEAAPGQYADLTLSCPLRVQGGDLPSGLLAEWHRSKRFARVAQHGDFVVLEMDVLVAGGVSREYLNINLQLWTQMMGQFFLFLRNFTPADTSTTPVVEAVSVAEEETVPA
ncbi:hypothetical protein CSQ93_17890 [Janthinobacterium sp. BJB426]|nr:hypothetical protein CSQ93_17890 [Janthinobacterium sp. BJB426]